MIVVEAQSIGRGAGARVGKKDRGLESLPISGMRHWGGLDPGYTNAKRNRKEQTALVEHAGLPGSNRIEVNLGKGQGVVREAEKSCCDGPSDTSDNSSVRGEPVAGQMVIRGYGGAEIQMYCIADYERADGRWNDTT